MNRLEEQHALSDNDTLSRLGGDECDVFYGGETDRSELRRLSREKTVHFIRVVVSNSLRNILLEVEVKAGEKRPEVRIIQAVSYVSDREADFFKDRLVDGILFAIQRKLVDFVSDAQCELIHDRIVTLLGDLDLPFTKYRPLPGAAVWSVVQEKIGDDMNLKRLLGFEFGRLIGIFSDVEGLVSEKFLNSRAYLKAKLSRGKAMQWVDGRWMRPDGFALFVNEDEKRHFVGGAGLDSSVIDAIFDQIERRMTVRE